MVVLLTIVFLLSAAAPAGAQIYEWRDASGDRHFTNDLEDVPEALRADARVVVRARPEPALAEVAAAAAEEVADGDRESRRARRSRRDEPEAPRQAQVIYDNSFRFARSRRPAPEPQQVPQVQVNIAGPLAVSQVIVPESPPLPIDYYYPGRIPLGLRPPVQRPGAAPRRPPPSASVLSPAPLSAGSPAFMPANMGSAGRRLGTTRR
jgi:hypothetical protein